MNVDKTAPSMLAQRNSVIKEFVIYIENNYE
jgi:hypothetical protein